MENLLLYDFVQNGKYGLKQLVDDYGEIAQDDFYGFIFHEYDDEYLRATYWQKKKRKDYRYNIEKREFEEVEEEVVNIAEFGIYIQKRKLIVFGNKQMAQRIITLIGTASKNVYSITECYVNIEKLATRICKDESIKLLKVKLVDIVLDKNLLVSCTVPLVNQDMPSDIVCKYIKNITVISFRFEKEGSNITVCTTGKISFSKIMDDSRDEVIDKIMEVLL